jgi:SAM-dependent methyltransferase
MTDDTTEPPRLSIGELYADAGLAEDEAAAALAELDRDLRPRGPDMLFDVAQRLGLPAARRVLDVGSRDGRHQFELARRSRARVLGIEPVAANRRNAVRSRASVAETEPDVAGRVAFVGGIAEAMPFATGAFDLVWVRDVLIHVPDLVSALRECRRVLAPAGSVLVFQMFATPWLEPAEAARLWPPIAVVPSNTDPAAFESAIDAAGLAVVERDVVASEWREFGETQVERRTSKQLLRAARLLRDRDRKIEVLGRADYEAELADCLWGVYQMIGKLSPRVYVLRAGRP